MLTVNEIENYLIEINEYLKQDDKTGEIVLAGGAVMALVYGARGATKDIDALFEPSSQMREIISKIAHKHNLQDDWLNDSVKGFFTERMQPDLYKEYSNLSIYTINAEAMLAMKLTSARFESNDQEDSLFLMNYLDIKNKEQLYEIVDKYIPENRKTVNSHYFIQDTFEKYAIDHTICNEEKCCDL